MPSKEIVIYGSFGFGNAGDEAVPEAVQDMLAELRCDARISVVSRFDKTDMPEVIGMGRHDAHRMTRLKGLPLLISGGGIIEPTHNSGFFRADALISSGNQNAYLFGVSVEPGVPFDWRSRFKLIWMLRKISAIYTRDVLSERTLKRWVPWARTETIGDVVLWMKPERTPLLQSISFPKRYVACVLAPRWIDDSNWTDWIVDELAAVSRKLDAAIVFVAMSAMHDDDRKQHAKVGEELSKRHPDIETLQINDALNPREVCEVLARSALTVSMRLHGCVMAYAQQVPFVCIAYHPKLLGFSETVGHLDCSLPLATPTRQSSGAYGYNYKDLGFSTGDLSNAAANALKRNSEPRLTELKQKSIRALETIIAKNALQT